MDTLPAFIGRYRIIRLLGAGGMAKVYLARDPRFEDSYVAIKALNAESEELKPRFIEEARIARRLRHPNIVSIFDVDESNVPPFIAMEYIPGQTLAQLIQDRVELPFVRKVQIIEDLCCGLAHAHRAKPPIVHRDIKPANVIIDSESEQTLKILDFGIARLGESSKTRAGVLMGSLNYMSPEQIRGSVVDKRSDMFAVGAVFYELLTYKRAFPGQIPEVFTRILSEEPEPIANLAPQTDREVQRIIKRLLEKDPARRYEDLEATRQELIRVRKEIEAGRPRQDPTDIQDPGATILLNRDPQLNQLLKAAQKAFDEGDHLAALSAAEQADALFPNEPRALALAERSRLTLNDQRVSQWLVEAEGRAETGALTEAMDLLNAALASNPVTAAVAERRRGVQQGIRDAQRAKQRQQTVAAALERGRLAFDRGAWTEALSAAEQAREIDPQSVAAQRLRDESITQLERQRREDDARAVERAIAEARALFLEGQRTEAIARLVQFRPVVPAVTAVLTELRQQAAEIDRREAEARRRQQAAEAALTRAQGHLEREAFSDAIVAADEALQFEPANAVAPKVKRAALAGLDARRRREQEEVRRRAKTLADTLDRARREFAAGNYAGALKAAEAALGLDPANAAARDLSGRASEAIGTIERALTAARTSRAARDYQATVRAAEEALALDPGHQEAQSLKAGALAAIETEQQEARAARRAKQQQAVTVALQRGQLAFERSAWAEALAAAEQARELDPQSAATLRLREAALTQLERQRREDEARAAAGAIAEARALFAEDKRTEAIARLDQFQPVVPAVTAALTELRQQATEIDRVEAATKRRQQAIDAALIRAKRQLERKAFANAIEAADEVLRFEPDSEAATQIKRTALAALDDRRRREQEDARRRAAMLADTLERGQREFAAKNFAGAVQTAGAALEIDPANADASDLVGRAREAIRTIEQAVTAARASRAARDYQAVVRAAEEVLALDPNHQEAQSLKAGALAAIEVQQREARAALRAKQQQQAVAAALQRGQLAFDRGAWAEALAEADQARQLDPQSTAAQRLREASLTQLERQRLEKAQQEQLRAAQAQQRQRAIEALALAQRHLEAGDFLGAIELANEALVLDPSQLEANSLKLRAIRGRRRQRRAELYAAAKSRVAANARLIRYAALVLMAIAAATFLKTAWDNNRPAPQLVSVSSSVPISAPPVTSPPGPSSVTAPPLTSAPITPPPVTRPVTPPPVTAQSTPLPAPRPTINSPRPTTIMPPVTSASTTPTSLPITVPPEPVAPPTAVTSFPSTAATTIPIFQIGPEDIKGVENAINQYQSAFENLKAAELKSIWPSVSPAVIDAYNKSFSELRSQTVTRRCNAPTMNGPVATVTCSFAFTSVSRFNQRLQPPSVQRQFALTKQNAKWLIDSVK